MAGVQQATTGWIYATLDAGQAILAPTHLDALSQFAAYARWIFGVITLDPALFDDAVDLLNITLPRRVLERLMRWRRRRAKAGRGMWRC